MGVWVMGVVVSNPFLTKGVGIMTNYGAKG